jgi:polar amino acid transport system substrate-binding protein
LLVRKGNPKRLHSYESLAKHPNATITVMAGAAEHGFARRAGVPEHRILPLQDPGAMLSAVKTSRADAASLTPSSITEMAKKGGDDVEMAKPFESPPWAMKYIAAPFHKDAVALREAFNRGLKEYVTSAHYQDVLARRPGAEHPGDMIAARQCTEE